MRRPGRLRMVLLPCLVLLALTLPHLEQGDFRRDTGRYAAVGLHMWSGGSLLQPHLNPETPYFNKPPLALWIHGAFLKAFGAHLAVARLPSILAALGVVCASVLTVRRIGSRSEAIVSGFILALTYEFFRRTREISLDFWQLLFLMGTVYLVVTAAKTGRRSVLVAAGVPLGLALLCKPLVALAMVPLLGLWLVWLGRARWIGWLLLGTVPAALAVALPWHLYMYAEFGQSFIRRYFFHEVVDRARGLLQTSPPWYYAGKILSAYWPWLGFVGFEIWRRARHPGPRRKPGRDLLILGGSWCVYTLVLISLFPDKKPNYALPLYPMLSWAAAAGLCRVPWRRWRKWYARGFPWLAPAAIASILLVSLAPIQFQDPPDRDWQAFFAWRDASTNAAVRLAHYELDPNDICYYYIRSGQWLPSHTNALAATPAENLFLLTRPDRGTNSAPYPFVFRSKKFAVFRADSL